jgi:Holliday junction resolvase RusA-like endonuclease
MPTFVIPGKPFAKQRPRATRQGRVYTPAATVSFERTVGQIAMEHFPAPITGPVRVTIFASFEPAKSWSKKRRSDALGRHHTQRPDLDNCQKAILDGLNRIAFADDGQVAEVHCRKVWGPEAQTVVSVEALEGWVA